MALRDAYHETDAVIDHLVYHPNTPPFIAKTLIQHFGISNPSPRYIKSVATAFKSGSYSHHGFSYGEGSWGDLAATAAAMVLDPEARTPVLDEDPVHGSVREPWNKVIGLMRSMQYQRAEHSKMRIPIFREGLQETIGQMPWEAPSVFSFFSPRYKPSGFFSQASLVSPEAQVMSMITVVGISNGLTSLIKYGMTKCDDGIGPQLPGSSDCDYPVGNLSYQPPSNADPSDVINELSTLLTSGRLSDENKAIILDRYNEVMNADSPENALKVAQQLMVLSPEFATSNKVKTSNAAREPSSSSGSTAAPYKAIINLYLFGGMDSFYMLSPHTTCSLYTEYSSVRQEVATLGQADMLELDATSSTNQPCERFGLHGNLAVMEEMYSSGSGLFFANTGRK